MSYLLDTNVVSELLKRAPNRRVVEWATATADDGHYLSVLTIGELVRGVTRLRDRGDTKQATRLEAAIQSTRVDFADRIVPITAEIAAKWGEQSQAQPIPAIDALIAATAFVNHWTVVTRNIKDMERTGARLHNPFG